MKKLLYLLLALLMLTPGQVCAMTFCAQAKDKPPCHGPAKPAQGPILQADCAKTDLQAVAPELLKKPIEVPGAGFMPVIAVRPGHDLYASGVLQSRGPPPDPPDILVSRPYVLLTTLRFRP